MLLLISGLNQQSKIGLTFKEGIHLHSHNYTQSVLCSLPCGKYFTALSPQATETWPGPGESAAWDGSKGMPAFPFTISHSLLICCPLSLLMNYIFYLFIYILHVSQEYKYLKARAFISFIHCSNPRIQDQSRSQTTH